MKRFCICDGVVFFAGYHGVYSLPLIPKWSEATMTTFATLEEAIEIRDQLCVGQVLPVTVGV